jgi:energy-coupling factor transport system permease protein
VACVGVGALTLEGAWPLAALAAPLWTAVLAHPRTVGWRTRMVAGLALLAWSTALSQALFWAGAPRTPWLVLWDAPRLVLWREGFAHGLVQSLRLSVGLGAGVLLTLTTSPDRLVAALVALRVPFGLAMMGAAAVRFVPTVTEETLAVRRARARRGRPVWARSPADWLALEAALLRPVVARALRRAQGLADALDARGMHPTAARGALEPLRMRAGERAAVVLAVVLVLAATTARGLYALYGAGLHYDPALRPLYAFVAFVRRWM